MAKMTIEKTIATITGMNVKVDDSFSVKIDVTIDCTGASTATMMKYMCGGQSARVAFQGTLRQLPKAKLREFARDGISVHINDVMNVDFFLTDEDKMAALFASLSPAQQEMFKAKFSK